MHPLQLVLTALGVVFVVASFVTIHRRWQAHVEAHPTPEHAASTTPPKDPWRFGGPQPPISPGVSLADAGPTSALVLEQAVHPSAGVATFVVGLFVVAPLATISDALEAAEKTHRTFLEVARDGAPTLLVLVVLCGALAWFLLGVFTEVAESLVAEPDGRLTLVTRRGLWFRRRRRYRAQGLRVEGRVEASVERERGQRFPYYRIRLGGGGERRFLVDPAQGGWLADELRDWVGRNGAPAPARPAQSS